MVKCEIVGRVLCLELADFFVLFELELESVGLGLHEVRKLLARSGVDKTTLLVSTSSTAAPGALYRLLEPLAKNRISMTRIESRPSRRGKWHYVFFIDIEGHVSDTPVARAMKSLKSRASLFRVIGSYPRSVL